MIKNGVTDNSSDSAFTGAWVKYLRLEKGYTQGYVAHGICSISHLSYFENGKKKLHDDQIAAVLKKLDVSEQKLLEYNIDNDIINYYEQTEQVTTQQEKIEKIIEATGWNQKKVALKVGRDAAAITRILRGIAKNGMIWGKILRSCEHCIKCDDRKLTGNG